MDNTIPDGCGYKQGSLPECAPLALAYVPMQSAAEPSYKPSEALSRGTLFPGLDLPFMNIVNSMPGGTTPLRELQALDFVLDELGLYLDTHKNDAQAFDTWRAMARLAKEARERYISLFGPLMKKDLIDFKSYVWLSDPWPWDYCDGTEGK